ncbi:MAG TPA: porin [Bryobacteraceae bacterium]|nr:porin [Bryobacteraceae bacterium]
MSIALRFRYTTWVCATFAILAAGPVIFAADADAASTAPQDIAAEIQQLRTTIREQRAAIDTLLQQVNAQEAALARMEARTAGTASTRPGPPTFAAVAPVHRNVAPVDSTERPKHWYERINFRGYTQLRYSGIGETNPNLTCEQCDRGIGRRNGITIRRARLVFSGDLSDHVSMYFQPDFASNSSSLHFGQIRDLYFDVALDKDKEFRIRAGQSKVPFGFENLQSSQNRLALDRADAINSAVVNERDLGVYLMWAPTHIRQRFKYLVDSGLKGSGDYGVLAAGVFNGQNANRPEANTNLHKVARFSYPMQFRGGRIIEAGVQAYTGLYTVAERGTSTRGPSTLPDRRIGLTFVVYPQPFGIQAEYNWGTGPVYTPAVQTLSSRELMGGYVQLMHRKQVLSGAVTAFFKNQYYSGGKKYEFDARRYLVRDNELGIEWQFSPLVELTGMYTRADRTYEDSRMPNNRHFGRLLRLQLQFNY